MYESGRSIVNGVARLGLLKSGSRASARRGHVHTTARTCACLRKRELSRDPSSRLAVVRGRAPVWAERPALRHVLACGSARRSIGAEAPSTTGTCLLQCVHRVFFGFRDAPLKLGDLFK
jgi:hypothetical protein